MRRNRILAAGILGFCILFGLTLFLGVDKIEADLSKRGKTLLDEKGLDWVEINTDGREILLTGIAPDQATGKRAIELIKELEGVSGVKKKFSYHSSNGTSNIKAVDNLPAAD